MNLISWLLLLSDYAVVECVSDSDDEDSKHLSYDRVQSFTELHGGIQEYKCVMCAKIFKHAENLRTHIQSHLGAKAHLRSCQRCKKWVSKYQYSDSEKNCAPVSWIIKFRVRSNWSEKVHFRGVVLLILKARINVFWYFLELSGPKVVFEVKKKISKRNIDFSLWGNCATTSTHICNWTIFPFILYSLLHCAQKRIRK